MLHTAYYFFFYKKKKRKRNINWPLATQLHNWKMHCILLLAIRIATMNIKSILCQTTCPSAEVHNGITTYAGLHDFFRVFNIFRKCSVCRCRKFRSLVTILKCRECKFLCHRKCLSKLQWNVNLDTAEAQSAIPVETDNQLRQTEPALQQTNGRPSNDENVTAMAMFLPQRFLMHIDYSELVDRVRAAKYVQRPKPLVNSTNRNYLFWGKERYLITKFEMDDGDEYYVLTTCLISDRGNRCSNANQYCGQTIFLYSPSPSPETEKLLTVMLIKPLCTIGIQNAVNRG